MNFFQDQHTFFMSSEWQQHIIHVTDFYEVLATWSPSGCHPAGMKMNLMTFKGGLHTSGILIQEC